MFERDDLFPGNTFTPPSFWEIVCYKLWYGRYRKYFRYLCRMLVKKNNLHKVKMGPMRKVTFFDENRLLSIYSLGLYELIIQYLIKNLLSPGMVFFDIGANNGYISLLAAINVGETGCVFAFEPLPQNISKITKNVNVNRFSNIEIIPCAVGSFSGMKDFFFGASESEGSFSSLNRKNVIQVEVITLDIACKQYATPDLIKIDVEGFEAEVLQGGSDILSKQKAPKIILEIHSEESKKETLRILRSHNYKWSEIRSMYFRYGNYPIHLLCWK